MSDLQMKYVGINVVRICYPRDTPPKELNFFILKNFFDEKKINVTDVRRYSNNLRITVGDEASCEKLFSVEEINGIKTEIKYYAHDNFVRGIIFHPELAYMNEREMQLIIDPKHRITQVRKLKEREDTTQGAVLFFAGRTKPESLVLGWDTIPVYSYGSFLRRRHRCQRYGHKMACTPGQDHTSCPGPTMKWVPCGGNRSSSRTCPVWVGKTSRPRRTKQLQYGEDLLRVTREDNEERDGKDQGKKQDKEREAAPER